MIRLIPLRRFSHGKALLASSLLVLSAAGAWAQTATTPRVVPPPGPLLQPIPSFAKWITTYTYPEDRPKVVPGTKPSPPPPPMPNDTRARKVTTTKTKNIVLEEKTDLQGAHTETWYVGGIQYWKNPGSGQWGQTAIATVPGTATPPAFAGTFSGLDWVNAKAYVGTVQYNSHTCLVFIPVGTATEDLYNPDILTSKLSTLTMAAFIDSDSRLPVEIRNGDVYTFYQFDDPPTQMQSLSSELVDALKKAKDARAKLEQR